MRRQPQLEPLNLDLSGLEVGEIETFLQDGSKGLPELAASCSIICSLVALCCTPSCNSGCAGG